jgi:hypothetical protein
MFVRDEPICHELIAANSTPASLILREIKKTGSAGAINTERRPNQIAYLRRQHGCP